MSLISDIFSGGAEGVFKGLGAIIQTVKADPTKVVELEAALEQARIDLDGKLAAADAQTIAAINASMQAESKSEHWLQWSWRPMNGQMLWVGTGFTIAAVIVLLYDGVFQHHPESLTAIPIVVTAMATVLALPAAVCGITAWHRGMLQREQAK